MKGESQFSRGRDIARERGKRRAAQATAANAWAPQSPDPSTRTALDHIAPRQSRKFRPQRTSLRRRSTRVNVVFSISFRRAWATQTPRPPIRPPHLPQATPDQGHPSRQHRSCAGQQPPINRDFSRQFKLLQPPCPPRVSVSTSAGPKSRALGQRGRVPRRRWRSR